MKRIKRIPVNKAAQPSGHKAGYQLQLRSLRSHSVDLKFQQGIAGGFHFRQQHQTLGWLHSKNPPEIHCFADVSTCIIGASAAKPRTAAQPIDPAAQPPQGIAEVIAPSAADFMYQVPERLDRGIDFGAITAFEDRSACPVRITAMGPFGFNQLTSICPATIYLLLFNQIQRQTNRFPAAQQLLRDNRLDAVFTAYRCAGQAFGQRQGNRCRHRADQVNPVGTQGRCQNRHRYNPAFTQMRFLSVDIQKLAIG